VTLELRGRQRQRCLYQCSVSREHLRIKEMFLEQAILPGGTDFMAKKSKREHVWLECTECNHRNYRTNISVAEGVPKLELKKFCKKERKHTAHKIRRK